MSPLVPMKAPLKENLFMNLSKGDCIIAFSRRDIYKLKAKIEHRGKKKCCVIYGSLPPGKSLVLPIIRKFNKKKIKLQ